MFLDWLERRIDPFAPFEEARRPPDTVAGFAWFYLRPVRGPLAVLFCVALAAGSVEASLYLLMGWFVDILARTGPGTLWRDHGTGLMLAAALIHEPKLLMLDEPSAGLSPVLVDRVLAAVTRLKEGGTAVILVEQLIDKALAVADRVVAMVRGRLVLDAPAREAGVHQRLEQAYLGSV